jgi:sugar/nucleoside kinase (ribokinase family)
MGRVWGFGTAAVDIRLSTADYGETYREKLLARETQWMAGGSVANSLTQVARLGGDAGWLGKLGRDRIGSFILQSLKDENVDASSVIIDPSSVSPFNIAVYAGDVRRRVGGFLLPNCLAELQDADLELFVLAFASNDILLIEVGEIPLECCVKLALKARDKGVHVFVDIDLDPIKQCGSSPEVVDALFSACTCLIPNETSLRSLFPFSTRDDLIRRLHSRYGVPVVLTEGADGVTCINVEGEILHVPAVPVEVIDTVGAGDAFHGGFLHGWSITGDIQAALELGSVCGAHNCLTFGAREGMIRSSDLERYREVLNSWLK